MKHPMGLYVISTTELFGRCCFLFFSSILLLFMIEVLHFSAAFASMLFGIIMAGCYLFQLITGHITDKYIGNRKSIIIGSVIMCIGQLILAYAASLYHLVIGIHTHSSFLFTYPETLFIVGSIFFSIGISFFKVSATSFVSLFYNGKEELLDSAYVIFYMLGNLGAFFAPVILNFVVGNNDPSLYKNGFLIAAGSIFIGLIFFLTLKDKYLCLENGDSVGVEPLSKIIEIKSDSKIKEKLSKVEIDRIKVIILIFIVTIILDMSIEQTTTSLLLMTIDYVNNVVPFTSITLSPEFYICLNPLFVTIVSLAFLKITNMLANKNKEPSSIGKISIGLMMIVVSYICLFIPAILMTDKMNMIWLVLFNLFLVFAEVLIGPISFSLISKLAPVQHTSLFIGASLAVISVSELLAGYFASLYPSYPGRATYLLGFIPIPNLISFIGIFIIISGLTFVIWGLLRGRIKKLTHGIE